jgi:hypothetical protein
VNAAESERFPFTVSVTGFAVPVAAPLHPANVAPLAGTAVTVTVVPAAYV